MADSHAIARDTRPEARRVQLRRWAEVGSVEKAAMIEAMCRDLRSLALAGIRNRFADASRREQSLRLGALTIDRETMIAAFGWDPRREGR